MEFGIVKQQENIEVLKAKLLIAQSRWNDFIANNPLYLDVVNLEKEIALADKNIDDIKGAIIQEMLNNQIDVLESDDIVVKLKDTSRPSVKILNEDEIPKEYKRVKEEVDKTSIMNLFKSSGIIVAGTVIEHKPNYKLDIKTKK